MATQKFHIIDNKEDFSDGIIVGANKDKLGYAWQNEAPEGYFISGTLNDHWIITDEELKEYKQLKKEHVSK